jgi:hypothetical protein
MHRLRHVSRSLTILAVAGVVAGLVGCSASVGTLYPSQVEDAIHIAELSVQRARGQDLSLAAKAALTGAEAKLSEARDALAAEHGVAAHVAAQDARLQAENALALDAQSDAYQRLLAEQTQQREDASDALASARVESANTRRAAEAIQSELRALRDQLAGLRDSAQSVADQKAAARLRQRELEAALSASRDSLRAMTELLDEATRNQSSTTQQVAALARQVEGAAEVVAQAEKRESDAAAEQRRARELAEAYSASIESTGREKAKNQALAKARASSVPAAPTIAPEEVRNAGPTLQQWKAAWERKDMSRHLTFYLPEAVGERISVRKGREQRTRLSHEQLVSAIQASDPAGWEGVAKSATRAEGSNVVAEIPYRRRDGSSALYDFWVRKAFWDRRGSDWRIVREEWRYYDAVPQFTDR